MVKQGTTRTQIFYVNSFKTHPSTFFSVCHALFFLLFSHAGFYRPENRENSCSRARVENWQWNINKTFRKIVRDITHAHSTSKRHIVIWASFFYVPSNLWRCSSRARDQNKKEKLKTKKREEKNEKRREFNRERNGKPIESNRTDVDNARLWLCSLVYYVYKDLASGNHSKQSLKKEKKTKKLLKK